MIVQSGISSRTEQKQNDLSQGRQRMKLAKAGENRVIERNYSNHSHQDSIEAAEGEKFNIVQEYSCQWPDLSFQLNIKSWLGSGHDVG
jgi:hypothetical protein